jgi:hypothetical protein
MTENYTKYNFWLTKQTIYKDDAGCLVIKNEQSPTGYYQIGNFPRIDPFYTEYASSGLSDLKDVKIVLQNLLRFGMVARRPSVMPKMRPYQSSMYLDPWNKEDMFRLEIPGAGGTRISYVGWVRGESHNQGMNYVLEYISKNGKENTISRIPFSLPMVKIYKIQSNQKIPDRNKNVLPMYSTPILSKTQLKNSIYMTDAEKNSISQQKPPTFGSLPALVNLPPPRIRSEKEVERQNYLIPVKFNLKKTINFTIPSSPTGKTQTFYFNYDQNGGVDIPEAIYDDEDNYVRTEVRHFAKLFNVAISKRIIYQKADPIEPRHRQMTFEDTDNNAFYLVETWISDGGNNKHYLTKLKITVV